MTEESPPFITDGIKEFYLSKFDAPIVRIGLLQDKVISGDPLAERLGYDELQDYSFPALPTDPSLEYIWIIKSYCVGPILANNPFLSSERVVIVDEDGPLFSFQGLPR